MANSFQQNSPIEFSQIKINRDDVTLFSFRNDVALMLSGKLTQSPRFDFYFSRPTTTLKGARSVQELSDLATSLTLSSPAPVPSTLPFGVSAISAVYESPNPPRTIAEYSSLAIQHLPTYVESPPITIASSPTQKYQLGLDLSGAFRLYYTNPSAEKIVETPIQLEQSHCVNLEVMITVFYFAFTRFLSDLTDTSSKLYVKHDNPIGELTILPRNVNFDFPLSTCHLYLIRDALIQKNSTIRTPVTGSFMIATAMSFKGSDARPLLEILVRTPQLQSSIFKIKPDVLIDIADFAYKSHPAASSVRITNLLRFSKTFESNRVTFPIAMPQLRALPEYSFDRID